jgi:hypothetical protein
LAARKSFLLRIDPKILEALRRWADDDLRSVNGQVEFLLRRALRGAGRLPKGTTADDKNAGPKT